MFSIGEFSKLTRVTIKMLRHYDDIGLLTAASTDRKSGYRYYSADQLPKLNRIIALKDLGFALEDIRQLVDGTPTAAAAAFLFEARRAALEREQDLAGFRLRQLDALMAGGSAGARRGYDVIVRAVAPALMATMRRRVPTLGKPVAAMFERLEAQAARHEARAPASPLLLFHDEDFREADIDVEVAVPVAMSFAAGEIGVREVEGAAEMACVVYRGGYDQMSDVLQTLLTWMERHARRIAGPLREVYLRFGASQADYALPPWFVAAKSAEFVTEVQLPLAPAAAAA